jgi:hypothetical protein
MPNSKEKNQNKELLTGLVILFCSLLIIELICFAFFSIYKERFTWADPAKYVLNPKYLKEFAKHYDASLGWKYGYRTQFGERPQPKDYHHPIMSAYGDSFTHCDQVRNAETWETYLAEYLKGDVYNFGVGGYGTDQAYLRFLQEFPKIKTPLVSLGIMPENINRIINVYRRFYFLKQTGFSVKPRFVLKDGELKLIENPISKVEDLPKLLDPNFLKKIGKNDWWYNHNNSPSFSFPFTAILFNKQLWREAFYRYKGYQLDDIDPQPWENTWDNQEARDLMFAIVDAFVKKAREFGSTPVIILFPREQDASTKKGGGTIKAEDLIMSYCKEKDYICLDGIAAVAERADSVKDISRFFVGHLSPNGNAVIARHLFDMLLEKHLVNLSAESDDSRLNTAQ